MYKSIFNKRASLKFKRFSNKGYSLFSVLGREVLIGTLSVATLTYAKADGISTDVNKVTTDSLFHGAAQELDEVSVTASRAPLAESQQARVVTVLSREDIARASVQSVNDVLKLAVGVDVRQKGPLGALTDVSVRGGSGEQVTILLNGINICDPQTGHNAFDFPCDISDIERIEVLEGPAARVYGTSSLLGAINIVTRSPQHTSLNAHVEGGSYGYMQAGARMNIASGKWNNSISGNYTRSDGYLRNKARKLNADYKTTKAFYQGNYIDEDVILRWHAGLSVKDFGSNTFYGAKWDDQFEHTLKTYTAIQGETRKGKIHFKPSLYWNRNMDRFELFRDASDKYPFNYHRTDIFGANLNGWFDWALGCTAFGGEIRNEDLVSGNLGEPLDNPKHIHGTDRNYTRGLNRTNIQFVLEHNILLDRFTLSAGLTAVKNSQADMGMRVYPAVDMSYQLAEGFKLFASYNSSLRMPSVTELYYSVGGHKADKHLKPEELSAIEAGAKYQNNVIKANLSAYYNHYTNLIDWISDGTLDETGATLWMSRNFGKINAIGVESNITVDMLQLMPQQHFFKNLSLAYNWIHQEHNEAEGIISQYALEYLKNKFVAGAQFNIWSKLNLDLNYRLQHRMGSYVDIENNVHQYSTYGILDGKLSWNESSWKVYLEGNNLLNKSYVDYGNVAQPGTWVVAGFAINLY